MRNRNKILLILALVCFQLSGMWVIFDEVVTADKHTFWLIMLAFVCYVVWVIKTKGKG